MLSVCVPLKLVQSSLYKYWVGGGDVCGWQYLGGCHAHIHRAFACWPSHRLDVWVQLEVVILIDDVYRHAYDEVDG